MKFIVKYIILLVILSIESISAQGTHGGGDSIRFSYYHIVAERLNLDIVNTYPQKIERYISTKKPYNIIIKTFSSYQDSTRRKLIESKTLSKREGSHAYPENVKKYLERTSLIESSSPRIKIISDSLVDSGKPLLFNIQKILQWVSVHVEFDQQLADKIIKGESNTQSAIETLERGKGTCSEYTNLFTAIMRNLGIPTKFITGVIIEKGNLMYHAWAECYIEGVGWHGVDPQTAQVWIPDMGIKLFAGKDFLDCNIKTLDEIQASVKKIDSP